MPQMSPMNWIFICLMFIFIISLTSSFFNLKASQKSTMKMKNKNIMWKW